MKKHSSKFKKLFLKKKFSRKSNWRSLTKKLFKFSLKLLFRASQISISSHTFSKERKIERRKSLKAQFTQFLLKEFWHSASIRNFLCQKIKEVWVLRIWELVLRAKTPKIRTFPTLLTGSWKLTKSKR